MRIGINASNTRSGGGQFQFLVMFLDALFTITGLEDEIYLFYFSDEDKLSQKYKKDGWHWIDLRKELRLQGAGMGPARFIYRLLEHFKIIKKPQLKEALRFKYKLDFIFFPTWTEDCYKWGIPFAFTAHDLQHRLQPEFPEVSACGIWNWRESFFLKVFLRQRLCWWIQKKARGTFSNFMTAEKRRSKYCLTPSRPVRWSA
jgi:hypothetical protein